MLRLDELVERGSVNEVWLLADHTDHSAPWETVEVKRAYDEDFRPLGFERYAGNSGEHSAPWIGRSLRILFVNFARGVGCAMESLGHSLERMATCGAVPYYERYFREYAASISTGASGCRSSRCTGRPGVVSGARMSS